MYYESAYQSLLGGVSQQVPHARLPSQLTEQINMYSDPVRGLRRRAPMLTVNKLIDAADINYYAPNLVFRRGNIAGLDILLVLCTHPSAYTGTKLRVFNARTGVEISVNTSANADLYLEDMSQPSLASIASVSSSTYLVYPPTTPTTFNTSVGMNPARAGYFFIPTGAYNLEFSISIINKTDNVTYSATYTTPNGTGAGDPALSTPEYIANDLMTTLDAAAPADFTFTRDGPYVFVRSLTKDLEVVTGSNNLYVVVSNNAKIQATANLPARLPSTADGFRVRVGNDVSALHFRYDSATQAWLEDAEWDSQEFIDNMGLVITGDSTAIDVSILRSKTRAAGDAVSNPHLALLNGITGIFAFQGRLGLLADQYVCLSGVDDPTLWHRSTVTQLLDSDPIEMALTTTYSSPYKTATLYNDDLIIFADEHQVRVPGDIAITPRNAVMGLVSNFTASSIIGGVSLGQSLIIPTKGVENYVGVIEATPANSQVYKLSTTNITAHLPTYMQGNLAYIAASASSEIVVLGAFDYNFSHVPDNARYIYVHQYLWDGENKAMSAWHKWEFQYPVVFCYFIQDILYTCFMDQSASLWFGQMKVDKGDVPKHFLDYAKITYSAAANVNGDPALLYNDTFPTIPEEDLRVYKITGQDPEFGETPALFTYSGNDYLKVSGDIADVFGDEYAVGVTFKSLIEPTPPILRDRSERVLIDQNIPMRLFKVHVNDTGSLVARVRDLVYDSGEFDVSILNLYSPQSIGSAPLKASGKVVIPARTQSKYTAMQLWTEDYYDFTITTIEYGVRLSLKHKRI